MPKIDTEEIGLAFDMRGCPNRCRHCYLGPAGDPALSEQDVRWGVSQVRAFLARGNTPIRKLTVATWFREPDFGDDYRRLYDLEIELSDGRPHRYELLSIWRLSRDDTYARWARSVGPDTCQISFFGMGPTTDWFYRRTGAFDDALEATERLLAEGMKPRWQLFLTTKLLPELTELLGLVDRLRLRPRVGRLGGEFEMFLHPPGPDFEGRKLESLRPTAEQVATLPEAIMAPTRRHFERNAVWQTEAALLAEMDRDTDLETPADALPDGLWFFVRGNWDVFSNLGTLEPWWRLGNLRQDPVREIIDRFESDDVLGLRVRFHEPPASLAGRYGDAAGQRIYSTREDLLSLYRATHCETEWNSKREAR